MIVRSFETIHRIKQDFENVKVVFIVGGTGETLKQKLLAQGRHEADIDSSDIGVSGILHEYVENIDEVDHIIINYLYDEELYLKQFLLLIGEEDKYGR